MGRPKGEERLASLKFQVDFHEAKEQHRLGDLYRPPSCEVIPPRAARYSPPSLTARKKKYLKTKKRHVEKKDAPGGRTFVFSRSGNSGHRYVSLARSTKGVTLET